MTLTNSMMELNSPRRQDTLAVHRCDNLERQRSMVLPLKRLLVRRSCNFDRFEGTGHDFHSTEYKHDPPQTINCHALAYSIMYLRHHPRLDWLS